MIYDYQQLFPKGTRIAATILEGLLSKFLYFNQFFVTLWKQAAKDVEVTLQDDAIDQGASSNRGSKAVALKLDHYTVAVAWRQTVLHTLVDEVAANIVVEQGVVKMGGILVLDESLTLFVQGDLVCCMTPWAFFEAFKACQKDCLCASTKGSCTTCSQSWCRILIHSNRSTGFSHYDMLYMWFL
jgi:hypothetical protein